MTEEKLKEIAERILEEEAYEECPKCRHYLMYHIIVDDAVICKYEDILDDGQWFYCICEISLEKFLKLFKEND